MLFGKKKKKTYYNSEYYELLIKFNEVTKKPDLTIAELNKQYNLLLKPAIARKHEEMSRNYAKEYSWLEPAKIRQFEEKSQKYVNACLAQERNYYRTFYRLSPGNRDKDYAKKIKSFRIIYNIMQKKENQNNPVLRKLTDTFLKEIYKQLCTELYKYGRDQKYLELNREFYRLRDFYYNDLKGKQYYKVTLGYKEEYDKNVCKTFKMYVDSVSFEYGNLIDYYDEDINYRHQYYAKEYVPIYAVDDEKGLHDVISGQKVYRLTKPDVDVSKYVWYTKLEPVDERTAASGLSFLVNKEFLKKCSDYKSRYQKAVEKEQKKCLEYFEREYSQTVSKQRIKEKSENDTAETLKILNKNL